jgi:hypothetical protein
VVRRCVNAPKDMAHFYVCAPILQIDAASDSPGPCGSAGFEFCPVLVGGRLGIVDEPLT